MVDEQEHRRHMVYDKQVELPIHTYKDKTVYEFHKKDRLSARDNVFAAESDMQFFDPYYGHQWYLVSILKNSLLNFNQNFEVMFPQYYIHKLSVVS